MIYNSVNNAFIENSGIKDGECSYDIFMVRV